MQNTIYYGIFSKHESCQGKLFSALAQRLQARFQNPGSSGYVGDYAICPADILCYLGIRISYSKGPY